MESQDEVAAPEPQELPQQVTNKASSLAPLDEDVAMDSAPLQPTVSHEALTLTAEPSPVLPPTPSISSQEESLVQPVETVQSTQDVPVTIESDQAAASEDQVVSGSAGSPPNEPIPDGTQSISRRTAPQYLKTRPTTIHGEPMPHSQSKSASPFFGETAAQPQLTFQPPQVPEVLATKPVQVDPRPKSQLPSQTPTRSRRRSVKAPATSSTPVIPARRDSLGVSVPIQFVPPPVPLHSGQHTSIVSPTDAHVHTHTQLLAPAPIQSQAQTSRQSTQSSSATTSTHSRNRSGSKTHRKGPSSSGRLLGFLGGLSKKHSDQSNTQPPASPEGSHDETLAEIDQPTYPQVSALETRKVAPLNPPIPTYQPQQFYYQQQQQHGVVSSYDTQKSNHSQRGKRRKTLSLVAGTPERPIHHERQQLQQQSLHHPLSIRPHPPPVIDGSILAAMNGLAPAQADRSAGTAQRIMGWLRRKSIVKTDRPSFEADESRANDASARGAQNAGLDFHPKGLNGYTSDDAGHSPSGSGNGGILTPIQALEEGRDPSLAALIQALPPNWTDAKLKVHSGAVELSSLSSRHPAEIMFDIKKVVLRLGMEIKSDSDFKIKCVRRKRKVSAATTLPGATSAGMVANGAGHNGGLSVKGMLQGHGLHRNPLNSGAIVAPDDTASVMSSNISIDREAWMSTRNIFGPAAGAGVGAGVGAGAAPGNAAKGMSPPAAPGSTAGSATTNGRKRNAIRSLLWRNSTSVSLASAPQPNPATHLSPSNHTRQLPQVMNGSTLTHSYGAGVGTRTPESGHASTSAGPEAGARSDSETDQPRPTRGGVSPSTTTTTIGAATITGQHRREPSDGSSGTVAPATTRFALPSEPLYGEEAIDSGEEIRFSIELCRIKNLPGLYSVDIRRMKGNLWAYKFLYHAVLNTLDLQGKGGYLTTAAPPVQYFPGSGPMPPSMPAVPISATAPATAPSPISVAVPMGAQQNVIAVAVQ
ncbi:hypothetical protein B0O80DRAFT_449624 [Mortierella sp. GBAus27b]|nr:hypothetical protein B0O80DRAFT_449624 [Mortierella sp. GBAus27b]